MRAPERLGFLLARTLRREAWLRRWSVPTDAVLAELAGKSVAIVGNARALDGGHGGADIDAADLVIRINRAPLSAAQSHGSRTDWLALATGLTRAQAGRIAPRRYLWMSHKRKRLPAFVAASPGFYLHEQGDWRRLAARLGAPPSTGALVIDLVGRSRAARIAIHGFDFFASRSHSGRRTAGQVPHDFAAEGAWVRAVVDRDPRFTLIPL